MCVIRAQNFAGENKAVLCRQTTVTSRIGLHPVIMTMRDNKDYIRALFIFLVYRYYRAGGGVPPRV